MADVTFQQLYEELAALKATLAAHVLETTKNTLAVQALTAKITGGVVVPPVDPPPVEPPPPATTQKWGVQGRKFTKDGVVIPFLKGANCRQMAFYSKGTPHKLPDHIQYFTGLAHIQDVDNTLNTAVTMGCQVVRVYAAIETYPDGKPGTNTDYCIDRVTEVVDYINNRGMTAIVVLNDNAGSPFRVGGDNSFIDGAGHYTIDWYKERYKVNYLPFAVQVIQALKNKDVWFEPGNEYASQEPHNTKEADIIFAFMMHMASVIRENAPGKIALPGNVSLHELFAFNKPSYMKRLVEKGKGYHAFSVHIYDPSDAEKLGFGTNYNQIANHELTIDVPTFAGEVGVTRKGSERDASPIMATWLTLMKQVGIAGAAQWNLSDSTYNLGWGDGAAMDNYEHSHDFHKLKEVWARFS